MTNWTVTSIGDAVLQMKTGSTPSTICPEYFGGEISWFTPGDIGSSKKLVNSARTITKIAISTGNAKLFDKGSLLVTCIGDIGRVGVLQQQSSSNQQITALKFQDDIDPDFAYYWFLSNRKKLINLANQAIVPILNNERLSEIEFSYPPLAEQKRIAGLLARADRLRRLRRFTRTMGDSLLQSVFLEMFGDMETNSGQWDKTTIEEIATQVTDGEHITPQRTTRGIKLLSARNIQNGYIDFNNGLDYISQEEYERIKVRLNPELGDVLMSCSGSIGRVTTVDIIEPFSMVRSVALIKPVRNSVIPKYLEHYLRSAYGQYLIFQSANISGQPNIFQRQIRELKVILPPLPLQEQFAQVVAQVERLRARQAESARQGESLFQALLSQSFGGEHAYKLA